MSVLASPEYVNAGSRMTWTGQFSNLIDVVSNRGPADIVGVVASTLLNNYNLVVERFDNGVGTTGISAGCMTLYLRTNIDRGDGENDDGLTDILNNVNDAFTADGHTPSASAINDYTPASSDGSTSSSTTIQTGTPLLPALPTASPGIASGISSWWSNLVGNVEAGSVGFMIGAVVVIGVVIYFAVKAE